MGSQATEQLHAEYRELMASIFDFMLRSGLTKSDVLELVMCTLHSVTPSNSRGIRKSKIDLAAAALVLDAWYRNRRYLTESGDPKAVPLTGRGPSVEALIRSQRLLVDPHAFTTRLRTLGLLMRVGPNRYKPRSRFALVGALDPLIQRYVAQSSSTLLKTILYNVTTPKGSPRLIERFAEVPDLPARNVAEFRKFAQSQGGALLKTLNDWLESRRAHPSRRQQRCVRAGVHLYAYVSKPTP
jgi:Family of unknown function (DUF6502)